jgi:hypothetical protein
MHVLGLVAPATAEYFPSGQGVHEVALLIEEYVAGGHGEHIADPVAAANVPAEHA